MTARCASCLPRIVCVRGWPAREVKDSGGVVSLNRREDEDATAVGRARCGLGRTRKFEPKRAATESQNASELRSSAIDVCASAARFKCCGASAATTHTAGLDVT